MAKRLHSFRLEESLWRALEEEARRQKRSVNNLVEVILSMAVEDDAPEPLIAELERRR